MRWLGLVVVAGCGIDEGGLLQLNDAAVPVDALADVTPKDASVDTTDSAVVDVIPEAPPPPSCNISTKPFGAPTNLGANVNTTEAEWLPWLTDDELTVYFTRAMGMNVSSLYFATRALPTDTFGPAQQISSIATGTNFDMASSVAGAFAKLYFVRFGNQTLQLNEATGVGMLPNNWTGVGVSSLAANNPDYDYGVTWCASTSELWIASNRGGGSGSIDLWVSAGGTANPPTLVSISSAGVNEFAPTLTSDGLSLYYGYNTGGPGGTVQVWSTTRASTSTLTFATPAVVASLNPTNTKNIPGWLSPDGCRMYFASDRPGGGAQGSYDIWMATRSP